MRRTHRRARPPQRTARREASPVPRRARGTAGAGHGGPARDAGFLTSFQLMVGEIFRLNGRLLDAADALARDLHVTPTHWQIIAIVRNQPMTVPAISRRVGLRRQSVQHNIRQLLDRGLVEQADNPDHRRSSLVRLSPGGRELLEVLLVRQVELTRQFTEGLPFGQADLEEITERLRRMRERAEGRADTGS